MSHKRSERTEREITYRSDAATAHEVVVVSVTELGGALHGLTKIRTAGTTWACPTRQLPALRDLLIALLEEIGDRLEG